MAAPDDSPRGPSDPADYSASKAPETQAAAEDARPLPSDYRLLPGGERGVAVDPGMSSLDRDVAASGGRSTGQDAPGATGRRED